MRLSLTGTIVLTLLVAGCGSEDSSPSGGSGGSAASAGSGGSGGGSGGGAGSSVGGSGGTGATGGGGTGATGGSGTGATGGGGSGGGTGGTSGGLSAKYPGDVGIDQDPDVVWTENFEEGSVQAVVARYDDYKSSGEMGLVFDVPAKSSGKASMQLTAGGSSNATDFFKKLDPGYDELYVRYYAKYQSGVTWHHTGVWVGGYNPPIPYPSPQAGLKPNGDDRFSVSLEPISAGPNPRLDFYNYWMKMHSWMDNPSGSTAYYGNSLVHQSPLKVKDDQWMCIELHIKVNPDPNSSAGAEPGVWMDDVSVQQFSDTAPLGYWIKDKFCPQGADGKECTDYPPASGTQMIPLDLQYRNTAALKLNAFWPQNYITEGGAGNVWYDDMVVAKKYIGCIQ